MRQKEKIIIAADVDHLAARGADMFLHTVAASVEMSGRFIGAISGGNTPREMHRLLAREPYRSALPWKAVHLFWVDERMVSYEHPTSNYGAAQVDFLENVPIPREQIHPMPFQMEPEEGAAWYEEKLKKIFKGFSENRPIFDLVFLGIGEDGHTASLFPEKVEPSESDQWVLSVRGGVPNLFRLTLNYTVLNSARHVCFLISGRPKARVIRTILERGRAILPAARIMPKNGKLTWLLDREAAVLLPQE
ncbi:6-phosphogluconolactonase [Thermodesulfobacteriota bacterium]